MFDFLNPYLHTIITIGSFIIFGITLVGVMAKKNLFKIFISLSIAEASLFLFFIGMHYEIDKKAPIVSSGATSFDASMADPVPQAMILTTIVIAIAILSLALSFIVNYHKLTNNLDIDKMDELGDER